MKLFMGRTMMHVDAEEKGKTGREKVINKKRHPSIWTNITERGKMGRRNTELLHPW